MYTTLYELWARKPCISHILKTINLNTVSQFKASLFILTLLCYSSHIGGSLFTLLYTAIMAKLSELKSNSSFEEWDISSSLTYTGGPCVPVLNCRQKMYVVGMKTWLTNAMCLLWMWSCRYALKYECVGRVHGFRSWHILNVLQCNFHADRFSSSKLCSTCFRFCYFHLVYFCISELQW